MKISSLAVAACALAILAASPAWAINKCIEPGGRIAFQDLPCQFTGDTLNVRPASDRLETASGTDKSGASAQTKAKRIEAGAAASQKERRLREAPAAD